MASNLNTPADFSTSKPVKGLYQCEKMDLLPPSAFETGQVDDAWKELARATNEVMKLKLENQKLREAQNTPTVTPVQPIITTEKCKYPRVEDRKYIDELITKQASEINELRNEVRNLKCNHKEEVTELEKQSTLKERQFIQTIASLEAELKTKEDKYDNQIDRLSQEHQKEVEELNETLNNLQDELRNTKMKSRSRITELERELDDIKQKSSSTIDMLQHESKSKDMTINNQNKQITKLKNYVGESEKAPKPVEVWRKEKETLENKLMISEADRENLESNLQLLNVRLSSMNEILTLQETELSRNVLDRANKNKQESLLLTRWREKVFAMMIQQKSSEIVYRKDEQNWNEKINGITNQLVSANNQIEVLSHSLSDKQAQLDIANNNIKKLEHELTQAQQLALILDDKRSEDRETAEFLQQFSERTNSKFEENFEILQSVFGTLKAYNQRISFASGRIEMLQGLFSRRESMLQLKLEEAGKKPSDHTPTTDTETMDSVSFISAELEKVTRERDSLVHQLKEDSTAWNEKLQAIALQYEGEIDKLKQTVEELELVLQEKSQRCNNLSETLEKVQLELDEANDKIENFKTDIAKQQITMEQVLEEQKTEIQSHYSDQIAELDRKLNDARREQTKAVVSFRQLERQSNRDKERSAEHLKTVEDHYTKQLEGLQQQLRAIEKERNLMMATLRQEGLIGKLKSERGHPVQFDLDPNSSQQKEVDSVQIQPVSSQIQKVSDEPITSVLEDLKSLTSAVLKDDVSSSDSED